MENIVSRQVLKNNFQLIQFVVCAVGVVAFFAAVAAHAYEPQTSESTGTPCAVLENFGGDVEVLDPSRTRVAGLSKNTGIPCGGWVSSGSGWAIIHHRDGHDLRIGPNTFLEIPESQPKENPALPSSNDQVVLYRGEMFGSTTGGGGQLRIVTANARVRMDQGTVLINFSPDEQDTQLVALDHTAMLENRFEPTKKVRIQAGESTDLNFKEMRVIPTYPKAVSIASLHEKLALFKVTPSDQAVFYETAQARAERRLAVDLQENAPAEAKPASGDGKIDESTVSDRKIASEGGATGVSDPSSGVSGIEGYAPHPAVAKTPLKKHYTYNRDSVDQEENQKLKAQWAKKMTAGEDVGERILYPDKFYGKPQKVKVLVSDPGAAMDAQKRQSDDAEKNRLMRELSQIQE
jgi:hypothetical protein